MSTKISRNPGTSPLSGDGIQFGDGTALVSARNGVGASGTWNINISGYSGNGIPAGYAVPFFNTSAPVGWTKLAINDAAFRLVSGAGGSTGGTIGFSTVFSAAGIGVSGSVTPTSLSTAQIPTHSHNFSDPGHSHTGGGGSHSHPMSTGTHDHFMDYQTHSHGQYKDANDHRHAAGGLPVLRNFGPEIIPPPTRRLVNQLEDAYVDNRFSGASIAANGTGASIGGRGTGITLQPVSFSLSSSPAGSGVSVQASGGGGSHDHTYSGSLAGLNVQYIDLIICRKN